jgi:hypothetical protein
MENTITKEKLEKYFDITSRALLKARGSVTNGRENEAKEIIEMVENYLSDARYFQENNNFVNAFAALNYAHGWLDSGARLKIFDVNDNTLFTVDSD